MGHTQVPQCPAPSKRDGFGNVAKPGRDSIKTYRHYGKRVLQNYRSTFIGVKCIIDEVSMIGCDVLHKINLRLPKRSLVYTTNRLAILTSSSAEIFIRLPPINASPVYKGPRNSICGPVLWQSARLLSTRTERQDDWLQYANGGVATARRNLHKMSVVESGGLPYCLKLAVGYPYMITMNLDVEDGLVNGAIGTLKYIEYLIEDEQSKSEVHVMRKRDVLDLKWTPIVTRAANVPLAGNIKCRRNQFRLCPQARSPFISRKGGTFHESRFNYDKSQQIQLVYVVLSRVTSIDGLYHQ
ncbi:ATP-dependent DNA helicase [Trichonephila clavipes]|nr:ATP-dependent DNA helicase [Trichonephila clavipes]